MCFDTDANGECHVDTPRRARTPHACCECGEAIRPGARYLHSSGIYERRPYAYSRCLPCVSLRDAVVAHEEAEGCRGAEAYPPTGELWECAREVGVVCVPSDRYLCDDGAEAAS
jgi:hypothetical protein